MKNKLFVRYIIITMCTVNFGAEFNLDQVSISSSGPATAGDAYSLTCSATLRFDSSPLPATVPIKPIFVWSFGPNGNDLLPSGVTPSETITSDNISFTSTLEFSRLNQSRSLHIIGKYTCRLGAGRLVNSFTIDTVNGMMISIVIVGYTYTLHVILHSSKLICRSQSNWKSSVRTKWLLPHMQCLWS